MKTRTGLVVIAGIALTAGLARADDSWKKIENKSFSFSVPATFQKIEVRGIDSFVEEYKDEGIRLCFDYGKYSNNFSGWPKETKFETVKINGVEAKIGTESNAADKDFPKTTQVYFKPSHGDALEMHASCKSEKELAVARKIFESIVFKEKRE